MNIKQIDFTKLSQPLLTRDFIRERRSRFMLQKENTQTHEDHATTSSSNVKNKALSIAYTGNVKEYCETHINEIKHLVANQVTLQSYKYSFFNEQDKEDAVQEAIIFLWDRLGQYDPSKAVLSTFIVTVINSHIFNQIRNKKRYLKNLSKVIPEDKTHSPYKYQSYYSLPTFHGIYSDISNLLQKGLTREQIQTSLNLTPSVLNYHIKHMKDLINEKRETEIKCGY